MRLNTFVVSDGRVDLRVISRVEVGSRVDGVLSAGNVPGATSVLVEASLIEGLHEFREEADSEVCATLVAN